MTHSRAKILFLYIFSFLILFLGNTHLSALQNTFHITANIIDADNNAPTVPSGVIATAASSNQINISWNASTDNIGVAGYRIYRDNVIIATTSSTSYSDIDLFEATLYAYEIDAFDAAFNFSARSATSTETTLPASSGSSYRNNINGPINRNESMNVEVYPDAYSAVLTWNTKNYTRANVYWGETQDYEAGVISGVIFQKGHIVKIENLIPDTKYFYKIELESNDRSRSVYMNSFITKDDVSGQSLPEGIVLNAKSKDNSIKLSWDKNHNQDARVRIIRSDKFFPVDPYDGKLIYQGVRDTEFTDTAVEKNKTYYYALFVMTDDELYSAPSITKASIKLEEKIIQESVFSGISYSDKYELLLKDLNLADFDFIQRGKKLSFSDGGINLFSNNHTEVMVDADKIPLGIKAISITFTPVKVGAEGVSFLLVYSENQNAYTGIIPILDAGQNYGVEINIFDTKNNRVKTMHLAAYVEAQIQGEMQKGIMLSALAVVKENIILSFILVLLGIIIGFMARRL